jgi:TetR/AcrR family transcriptional repressor of mexJK operon
MATQVTKRDKILRAAKSCFRHDGYRTSVEQIAGRAGVAKQTVYHHFPSKDELFREVANDYARRLLVELDGRSGEDFRASLLRFALAYRKRILSADGIAMSRAFVAEVPRFKALARSMYAHGAGETARGLAAWLQQAMTAGQLRRDDPLFAAELLMGMLVGHDRVKRLYGAAPLRGAAEERHTARILDCFLRGYSIEAP